MTESFFIAADKEHAGALVVRKLHINIWNVSRWTMLAEMGFLIQFPSKYIKEKLSATLEINTPYASKDTQPECLHDLLAEERIIQLLFNEQVIQKINVHYGDEAYVPVFKLTSDLSFALFRPRYAPFQRKRELTITFDFSPSDTLKWSCLLDSDFFFTYTRFRYAIDRSASRCIHYDRHFFYKSAYIDLRINEARTGTSFYETLVPITTVQFFLITPLKKSTRDFGGQRNSVRLLETEKWKPYLRQLRWVKRPMLVHYWKKGIPDGSFEKLSYNSLAVITAERKEIRYLLVLVALLVSSTIVLPFWEQIMRLAFEAWSIAKAGWKWILGGIFAIGALIGGNLLWDVVKSGSLFIGRRLLKLISKSGR